MATKLVFKDIFKNKTVLITGANSGLGKNMAENYAKSGARVINLSRDTKKMESLNSKLNEYNNLDNIPYEERPKVLKIGCVALIRAFFFTWVRFLLY